jgi:hypothetical protein
MATHRGFAHGATFDWNKIERELEAGDWEADAEDDSIEVSRVWLGTIFGLTPSGKFYVPFACSNVAGDCKACDGRGTREPRTGKRIRARAKARQSRFSRGTVKRGFAQSPAGSAYSARMRAFRHAAFRVTDTTCCTCDGTGSVSAARDARWSEALEQEALKIGAYVDYQDDSIFVARSREREDLQECADCCADTSAPNETHDCV